MAETACKGDSSFIRTVEHMSPDNERKDGFVGLPHQPYLMDEDKYMRVMDRYSHRPIVDLPYTI